MVDRQGISIRFILHINGNALAVFITEGSTCTVNPIVVVLTEWCDTKQISISYTVEFQWLYNQSGCVCVFVRRICYSCNQLIYGLKRKRGEGDGSKNFGEKKKWLNWWFKSYARLLQWIQNWMQSCLHLEQRSFHHKLKVAICSLDDFAIFLLFKLFLYICTVLVLNLYAVSIARTISWNFLLWLIQAGPLKLDALTDAITGRLLPDTNETKTFQVMGWLNEATRWNVLCVSGEKKKKQKPAPHISLAQSTWMKLMTVWVALITRNATKFS